jgi:hypothetical protein
MSVRITLRILVFPWRTTQARMAGRHIMHHLPTALLVMYGITLTKAQDIVANENDQAVAASILFCNSKTYGAYTNPSDPSCFYFCYGTVFTDTASNGYTSCCKTGSCFNLPSLAYPLGACLPCVPPPR